MTMINFNLLPMRNFSIFFLSLLFFLAFPLTFSAQTLSADNDGDGCVGTPDLLTLLSQFGECSSSFTCGDLISHDGYDYSTVQIGEQCWFSENCRYLPSVSPSEFNSGSETVPYYYVYDYEGTDVAAAQATSNYETYGVLYNWPAVMAEGICPSGWHIPSDGEWQTMEISLGMTEAEAASEGPRGSPVGNYLKSSTGWDSTKTWSGNGSDSVGFTGLPAGFASTGGFTYTEIIAVWWSATEVDSGQESYWKRILWDSSDAVVREGNWGGDGFSARCVRD